METTITTGQLISRLVVCVCLRTGCTVYTVVVCFCVRPWGDIYACINGLILGKSWLSKLKFMPTLTSPSSLDPILLLVVFWLDGNAKKNRIVFKLQHLGLKRVGLVVAQTIPILFVSFHTTNLFFCRISATGASACGSKLRMGLPAHGSTIFNVKGRHDDVSESHLSPSKNT